MEVAKDRKGVFRAGNVALVGRDQRRLRQRADRVLLRRRQFAEEELLAGEARDHGLTRFEKVVRGEVDDEEQRIAGAREAAEPRVHVIHS